MQERARTRPGQLTSYDCVLRAYEFYRVYTEKNHLIARDCLERAVQAILSMRSWGSPSADLRG